MMQGLLKGLIEKKLVAVTDADDNAFEIGTNYVSGLRPYTVSDYVIYRNFGNEQPFSVPPLFKEQCDESESGEETPANIWDYLSEVTEEEYFFAKNCVIYKEEGKRKISWEFGESDGYHQ
jgi:hypothetical protein